MTGKRVKKTSIQTAIPGFKRVKTGKTVNYVSEDGKIKLSRRQAEYVRDGKKSLAQAALTSYRGKQEDFPYPKRSGTRYSFKSFFDMHDAVKSGIFDHNRMMIISAHGKAKILYPGEDDTLYQWRSPVGLSAKSSYSIERYWEKVIDHIDDHFSEDPVTYEIIFLDDK